MSWPALHKASGRAPPKGDDGEVRGRHGDSSGTTRGSVGAINIVSACIDRARNPGSGVHRRRRVQRPIVTSCRSGSDSLRRHRSEPRVGRSVAPTGATGYPDGRSEAGGVEPGRSLLRVRPGGPRPAGDDRSVGCEPRCLDCRHVRAAPKLTRNVECYHRRAAWISRPRDLSSAMVCSASLPQAATIAGRDGGRPSQ